MVKYQLINPVIVGTFDNKYEAKTPNLAAQQFWEALTSDNKYVMGNIPKFLFTLKEENTDTLHHYMVKEKLEGGRKTNYVITNIEVEIDKGLHDKFLEKSREIRRTAENLLEGGKKHRKRYDDDSDTSDEDLDDLFRYIRLKKSVKPISYWWYTPSIYNIDTIFTPTFVAPLSPYTQLWIPN